MSRSRSPSKALVPSNQPIISPPIEMINRYQVLGNIPRPNYSSALATDPFASSSQAVSITPYPANPIRSARSDYIKSTTTNLFFKEPSHPKSQTVSDLAKSYFGSGCHFVLSHPDKTLTYYKDILLNHQSILIKPIQDRTYSYKILYHSIYIHNIVSLAEWGPPYQLRELPGHPIPYNYHDYIDAWFKIFLYQNETFSHSWFIQFDQKFKSELPSWFLRWWTHYGAISNIIPEILIEQINYFATVFPFTPHQRTFPLLLIFISKYKIPWIFKWHYGIIDNIIIRQHSVKWWDKFTVPRIVEIVQAEFPSDQFAPTPAIVKAQQNPTAAISRGSPSLPPVNLGSLLSSGSKPKSKVKSAKCTDKSKSKAVVVHPAQSKPKSKSKVKAKPISPFDQPKVKSKIKSKSSRDELFQLVRKLVDQTEAQSTSSSESSEEGSERSHSSEGSTTQLNLYGRPEF